MRISDWSSDVCSSDLAQDDSVDDHVAVLAALAMGEPAPPVQPSIAWALPDRLGKGDAASVATWFDEQLAAAPRPYVIDDRDLNQLGYDLLRHKRPADAVTVFGLLTRAYPGKADRKSTRLNSSH